MFRLSDNYFHRKCYFEREQVPTQTIMKAKMTPALAQVYFKSMTPKLKVLAGLEPPLKGGGSDWYMPPQDLLEGRAVLKPVKKQYLKKLGFNALDFYGDKLLKFHRDSLERKKAQVLLECDIDWKNTILTSCRQTWEDTAKRESKNNTKKIRHAFSEFTTVFITSMSKMEALLMDAAINEIKRYREETHRQMSERFANLVKQQATMLYDSFTIRLANKQAQLKAQFILDTTRSRTDTSHLIHDITIEKHLAVEKLRHLLHCENLACQIYVALKEREEFDKEIDLSKHDHKKKIEAFKEKMAMQEFELQLEKEKESKRQEFIKIWKQKICQVVKKFQMFVKYSLFILPQHADFFINMEKLMLLQISEALENPNVESLFEPDEGIQTPVPRPHPFYLFCDKGYHSNPDQKLCPKDCTSSASQLPVIVVNKRCIYAACDNFNEYTDLVTQYVKGCRCGDADVEDLRNYQLDVPVKYTSSQQLLELKLESSLMQVLQKELPNIRELPLECKICKIPYCFCSPLHASKLTLPKPEKPKVQQPLAITPSGNKIGSRFDELHLEREPNWESYIDYIQPKTCACSKTAKKFLHEHMPAYMRNVSKFEQPELPNYETCPIETLRKLVKKAQGKRTPTEPEKVEFQKTRNVSTQYEDEEFQHICNCFSDEEIAVLFEALIKGSKIFDAAKTKKKLDLVGHSISSGDLTASPTSFAIKRAYSLRHLLKDSPDLEEIFKKLDCN